MMYNFVFLVIYKYIYKHNGTCLLAMCGVIVITIIYQFYKENEIRFIERANLQKYCSNSEVILVCYSRVIEEG